MTGHPFLQPPPLYDRPPRSLAQALKIWSINDFHARDCLPAAKTMDHPERIPDAEGLITSPWARGSRQFKETFERHPPLMPFPPLPDRKSVV